MTLHPFRDFMIALKNDIKGLRMQLLEGRHEIVTYSKDNLPTGATVEDFELRNTDYSRQIVSRHSLDNIFEQQMFLLNELDKPLKVNLIGTFFLEGVYRTGPTIWTGEIPPGQRMFLVSDKSEENIDERVIPLVELRLPYPAFYFQWRALEIPTQGQVRVQIVRRY